MRQHRRTETKQTSSLEWVGRPDRAPVSLGERGEGEDVGLRVVHQGPHLGEAVGELVADLVPGVAGGVGVGLGEDRAEDGGDHVGVGLGDVGQQVAGEVDPAALVGAALEGALECGHQTAVLVGDDQAHPVSYTHLTLPTNREV